MPKLYKTDTLEGYQGLVQVAEVATTHDQSEFIRDLAFAYSVPIGEVMRWAIDSLIRYPDHEAPKPLTRYGAYKHIVSSTMLTIEQVKFIQSQVEEKNISKSQIMRNAIASLQQTRLFDFDYIK